MFRSMQLGNQNRQIWLSNFLRLVFVFEVGGVITVSSVTWCVHPHADWSKEDPGAHGREMFRLCISSKYVWLSFGLAHLLHPEEENSYNCYLLNFWMLSYNCFVHPLCGFLNDFFFTHSLCSFEILKNITSDVQGYNKQA